MKIQAKLNSDQKSMRQIVASSHYLEVLKPAIFP